MKGLCILGSTGSVGTNTLRVVESLPGRFRVASLAAGKNLDLLAEQVIRFRPQTAVVGSPDSIEPLRARIAARRVDGDRPLKILWGTAGQAEAATMPEVDVVVSASHGVTALVATVE